MNAYKQIKFHCEYIEDVQQILAKLSLYDIEFILQSDFKKDKFYFTIDIEDLDMVQLLYVKHLLVKPAYVEGIKFV
jgi:hypothetical protein